MRALLCFSVMALAVSCRGSATTFVPDPGPNDAILSWDAPTTNQDGTPLNDLAGFRVYVGTSSAVYGQSFDVGMATSYTVHSLLHATRYYFAVTAYDINGNESVPSAEVSKDIQ